MRIFKTLFSEHGTDIDLKSKFWGQLINLQMKTGEELDKMQTMFNDMANKRN